MFVFSKKYKNDRFADNVVFKSEKKRFVHWFNGKKKKRIFAEEKQ